MDKGNLKLNSVELLKLIKQLRADGRHKLANHFLKQYKELRRDELSEEDRAKLDAKLDNTINLDNMYEDINFKNEANGY